jgi:hypothetical protein
VKNVNHGDKWLIRRSKRQADVDENEKQEDQNGETTTTSEIVVEPEELVGRRKFYVEW